MHILALLYYHKVLGPTLVILTKNPKKYTVCGRLVNSLGALMHLGKKYATGRLVVAHRHRS